MSGTALAFDFGLLQPLAVPAAIEALAPPLWPLQFKLVLERIVQPDRLTFGAPLNAKETLETFPLPSVRMHEVSGSSPIVAEEVEPTVMDDNWKTRTNVVGRTAVVLPV